MNNSTDQLINELFSKTMCSDRKRLDLSRLATEEQNIQLLEKKGLQRDLIPLILEKMLILVNRKALKVNL